jgi:hypothetical protein
MSEKQNRHEVYYKYNGTFLLEIGKIVFVNKQHKVPDQKRFL